MIAVDKKTFERYRVIKYNLRVLERGSDTDFGKERFVIYNPISRSQCEVDRSNYFVCDNWKQADQLFPRGIEEEDASLTIGRDTLNRIKNMTPEERRLSLIDAGILTPEGKLADFYVGVFDRLNEEERVVR